MGIIIGGSGSTGSSLLAQLLNRHSAIFCGPETALFTKAALFDNWNEAKRYIPGKGLKGDGWHRYNGIDIPEVDFKISNSQISEIASRAHSFQVFVQQLFAAILKEHHKKIWAEKTPSNAISFHRIHEHFPEMQLVHCIRDPYDTIASLINRGFNEFYAAALYLVNTATGFSMHGDASYTEIRYEDLVCDPENSISALLQKIHCVFEPGMLQTSDSNVQLSGWKYAETGEIGTKSIGRFDRLAEKKQQRIIDACSWIRINPNFASKYGIKLFTIEDICAFSAYTYKPGASKPERTFRNLYRKEFYLRWIKRYPNVGAEFPVQLISV